MTDTFAVRRPTGATVTDPDTLIETPVYETVHESVKGRFQTNEAQTREVDAAGVKVAESTLTWHTPVSTVGVLTDDVVECIASTHDPELVGVVARVVGPFTKSQATARRFPVQRVS